MALGRERGRLGGPQAVAWVGREAGWGLSLGWPRGWSQASASAVRLGVGGGEMAETFRGHRLIWAILRCRE